MSAPKILRSDDTARNVGLALFAAGFVLLIQGYQGRKPPWFVKIFHPLAGNT